MITKYGFVKEENDFRLKEMIKNKDKLKEVYIDIYPENPFESSNCPFLLLRTCERNAKISINEDRLILKRSDEYETFFVNISISMIKECFSKINEDYSEFVLNVQNTYYRISIFN